MSLIITKKTKCEGCEEVECRDCCPHSDMDIHGCPDCGEEYDMGAAIDRAMDSMEDR